MPGAARAQREAIAGAVDRLDQIGGLAQLGAQAGDVDDRGSRRRANAVPPDLAEQIVARSDLSAVLDQIGEQPDLHPAHLDRDATDGDPLFLDIDLQRTDGVPAPRRAHSVGDMGDGHSYARQLLSL